MFINASLIVQMIVFLILVGFTMKYVWPPIIKALDERAAKIAAVLSAADKAKAELPGAEAQIEGGVVQGLGATLHEEMIVKDGIILNPTFAEYKIPATMDVPEIIPVFVETEHDEGPYGAKGLGEPVLAPLSPAVANAVFDAVGVRIPSLPITPGKVLCALEENRRTSASMEEGA